MSENKSERRWIICRFSLLDKKQKNNYRSHQLKMIKNALIHDKIGKHPEKIPKVKSFVDKCNWKIIS